MSTNQFTMTMDALERFTPEERQCYQRKEVKLQFLNQEIPYSYGNCHYNLAQFRIYKECNCSGPYGEIIDNFTNCYGESLKCTNKIARFNKDGNIICFFYYLIWQII